MNKEIIKKAMTTILVEGLGLDMNDPNLQDTPRKVADMYCDEFFCGMKGEFPEEECMMVPNEHNYDQIKLGDNIRFVSVCSHHFLPFSGKAWLLYIPNEWLIGASKMSRMITHYSCRPQIQAQLCHQVANRFWELVKPKGLMLVMRAIHGCMSCRGVNQYAGAGLTSSVVKGVFFDPSVKEEGLQLISLSISDRSV